MTTQEGKHPVYRLQGAGDEREGVEIPMRLKDINGDPIETVGGGGFDAVLSISFSGSSDPVVTEVVNTTAANYTATRASTGLYTIAISDDVLGSNPSLIFSQLSIFGDYIYSPFYSYPNIALSVVAPSGANTDITGTVVFSIKIND